MIQTSTSTISTGISTQNECSNEPLSEDEESFYTSIKEDLDKLSKQPRAETVEAILKFSKGLRG